MPSFHQKFRVWLFDAKTMVNVNDLDFEHHVLHYTSVDAEDSLDHAASELMESTLLMVGALGTELWEGDIVEIYGFFTTSTYAVEWYFQRWILRHVTKHTIKEITQKDLKNYRIVGHIYK